MISVYLLPNFDQHVYRLTGASPEQTLVVGTA